MVTEKDISSTEKLLDVIRKGADDRASGLSEAADLGAGPEHPATGREKKGLSFRARAVVGVEILEDGLRLVKMAKAGNNWRAEQALAVSTKTPASLDSPEFIAFLKQSLQRIDGIKKACIWAMIPTEKGEVWQVNVPRVKKDIYNAVFWTAKREKKFDESTTAFDYRILGETTESGAKKMAAEVFTAPREEIHLLKKAFARAGFSLDGITLSSFALQNLFASRRIDPGDEAFAVLFIGQESSSIDIHRENRMLLSRVIKTGRNSMVEAILDEPAMADTAGANPYGHVAGATVSPARARASGLITRLEEGDQIAAGASDALADVFTMIRPALERLARQVERTIDHSFNVLGNPSPTRLYLCGRLAGAPGVVDFFQEQIGLKVQVPDPLHPAMPHVAPGITSLKAHERIALVPAAGLAMSSDDKTPNFLCTAQDREKQRIAKRNGALVGMGFLAAALITGIFLFQTRQELAQARLQDKQFEQKLNERAPLLTATQINRMAADYLKRASVLRGYAQKFVPVAVLSELSAITPPNIRLLNVRLEMEGSEANQTRFVVVEGFIKGDDISFETHLSSYLFRIRNSPLFGDTAIQNSKTVDFESEGQVLRFVININLKQVTHERT